MSVKGATWELEFIYFIVSIKLNRNNNLFFRRRICGNQDSFIEYALFKSCSSGGFLVWAQNFSHTQ